MKVRYLNRESIKLTGSFVEKGDRIRTVEIQLKSTITK